MVFSSDRPQSKIHTTVDFRTSWSYRATALAEFAENEP